MLFAYIHESWWNVVIQIVATKHFSINMQPSMSGLIGLSQILSIYELGIFHANQTTKCLRNQGRTKGKVGRLKTSWSPPVILLLAVPRRLFCFGSLVVSDVVFRYLLLC